MYSLCGCVRLWIPWGSKFHLNPIFLLYQDIFKLVTEELSSLVIRDLYWPCISDQPRSFYQVCNYNCFLVVILHYFKLPGYWIYNRNGKEHLFLKFITMIDIVTGWFKVTQYSDEKAMTITNLVETTWLFRYPWPVEITFDRGGEFLVQKGVK